MVLILQNTITRNFSFVKAMPVILMSKMNHALEGQLSKINNDKIRRIVGSNHHVSTVPIDQKLDFAKKTVANHLNKAG